MQVESTLIDYSEIGQHRQLLKNVVALCAQADGTVIVADSDLQRVFQVTGSGRVSLIAGNGKEGHADGLAYDATFSHPDSLAVDSGSNIIVADRENSCIRKISAAGVVSTIAGKPCVDGFADGPAAEARFSGPYGIAVGVDDSIVVADTENHCIRRISHSGIVSTAAGSNVEGYIDGQQDAARFSSPVGIAASRDGSIIVADCQNNAVRKISPDGTVITLASASNAGLSRPTAVQSASNGHIFVLDDNGIHRISPDGVITKVLGSRGDDPSDIDLFDNSDIALCNDEQLVVSVKNRVLVLSFTTHPPRKIRRLAVDLANLLHDAANADAKFVVQGECIKAHRLILSARSTFFCNMLKSNFKEGQAGTDIVLTDTTAAAFRALLTFIYTDDLNLNDATAVEVMRLANMYDLNDLYERCLHFCRRRLAAPNCVAWFVEADAWGLAEFRAVALAYVAPRLRSGEIQQEAPESISKLTCNQALTNEVLLSFKPPASAL